MSSPRQVRARARSLALTAALGLTLCAAATARQAPPEGDERVAAQIEELLGLVAADQPEDWPVLAKRLAALGAALVEPGIERLAAGCPKPGGEARSPSDASWSAERAQVLTGALLELPRAQLRQGLGTLAARAANCPRLVGLQLLARVGDPEDLPLVTRLAAPASEEGALDPRLRRAYGQALEAIIARRYPAPAEIESAYGEVHPALVARLLEALARPRDARSLEQLASLLGRYADADGLLLIEIGRHGRALPLWDARDLLERVRPYLDSPRPERVIEASVVCAEFADGGGAEPLVELLDDPRPGVSQAAVRALGRLGLPACGDGVEACREAYLDEVRWWGEYAPGLLAALEFGEPVEVAAALRQLAPHELFRDLLAQPVAEVLQRPEPELALLACAVLDRQRSRRAVPALLEALRAPSADLRRAARRALAAQNGRDLGPEPGAWSGAALP